MLIKSLDQKRKELQDRIAKFSKQGVPPSATPDPEVPTKPYTGKVANRIKAQRAKAAMATA